MISTKEFAELSVVLIKFTTSTQENVTVLKELTLFKEFAQNANPIKPTMNTVRPVTPLLVQESMRFSQQQPTLAFANLNTSKLEEFVPTVTQVNTMTHTQIDASVNQDIENIEDTVKQFAQEEPDISMENASAPTVCLSTMENVKIPRNVLFTLIGIKELSAASVMPDTESSMENAAVTNTVESTDIFNTVNATAMMDTSGS